MRGNITALLGKKYRQQGYMLSEDEDFIYLIVPGDDDPHVFSRAGVKTIRQIEQHIDDCKIKMN